MIGLSFSRCVAEIAAGKVAIDDVEKIYARTATADWAKTIEDYKSYWENIFSLVCQDNLSDENCLLFVGKCQQIAKQILPRVFQPRIENNKYADCNHTFWVESEDEIVWRDDNTKVAQDIARRRFGF